MKEFFLSLGNIILFSIIVLIIYYVLHKFIFSKIKVNKWIIFIIAAIEFVATPFVFPNMPYYVSKYIIPGIFVILIIWFLDMSGLMNHYEKKPESNYYKYNNKKNDKDIKIKPKAKPNRVNKK